MPRVAPALMSSPTSIRGPQTHGSATADQPVTLGDAAGGGEDQRERVVGGGAVEDAGGVGDGDARGGGRGQVDVVEPDGDVGDDLQLRARRRRADRRRRVR